MRRTFIALSAALALPIVASTAAGDRPLPAPPRIGEAAPKARTEGAIRLATFNLENLFDGRDDPSKAGEAEDIDDTKPEPQRAALATIIRALDADIIALQEIESYDALVEFREQHLKGLGYDHLMSIDVGEERGIENAVISRFPITEARVWPNLALGGVHPDLWTDKPNKYAGQPLEMRRSPLFVTVQVPAGAAGNDAPYSLSLFVVHHKSGRGNEYWREAEAGGVLALVQELQRADPARNIAVLGDFNATPDDRSVRLYLDAGLADLHAERPTDQRGMTHASERVIDFILVNDNLKKEVAVGSAFVLGTPQLPREADWRTAPKPQGYASDHAPVVADLTPQDR